jgi:hypothetical protein
MIMIYFGTESEKNKKYLFFAPLASGKTIKNNISGNMPPMQMFLTEELFVVGQIFIIARVNQNL